MDFVEWASLAQMAPRSASATAFAGRQECAVNLAEYLDTIKTRLFTEAVVVRVEIRRERSTLTDAHLQASA